jgi:hypothetical protein
MHRSKLALVCALVLLAAQPLWAQQPEGKWSKAAPMTAPRSELQAISVANRIFVIGGNVRMMKDGEMATLPTTGISQVYDPASNSWRDIAPMPRGSTHNGIAALNGTIYIAGGFAHAAMRRRRTASMPMTSRRTAGANWRRSPRREARRRLSR